MEPIEASRADPPTPDPYPALENKLGFLPNLFRAQAGLPRVVAAEARIADAVIFTEGALGRRLKETLLVALAATRRNVYCTTAHAHILTTLGEPAPSVERLAAGTTPRGLTAAERELLRFALLLASRPTLIDLGEIERLRRSGFTDPAILEGILTVSLGRFLCTLAEGLGPAPDFPPLAPAGRFPELTEEAPARPPSRGERGPHLATDGAGGNGLPDLEFFRERFGFVPNIFRAQTLRPDVLAAEIEAIQVILLDEEHLSRRMKEFILLVVSARNLNTYCVAVHSELLRGLGVDVEVSDQVALDHHGAGLKAEESALLDLVVKLQSEPGRFGQDDLMEACARGWSEAQVLEAVVMTALSNFLNTLQCGLGPTPDFAPRIVFSSERVNPPDGWLHPSRSGEGAAGAAGTDPDAPVVARTRAGDLQAFEELVVRHHGRVFRVLMGLTASPEEAEDGTQEVFLKALQNIGSFRGASRFTTWLTRIAINEGLERVRSRRSFEPLAEEASLDVEVRPQNLSPWMDDPEKQLARQERRRLVERGILELPLHYRSAVLLRDVAQLSTAAAAEAMGLGIATFKTRLLRGRLLLREALAPHFARPAGAGKGHV